MEVQFAQKLASNEKKQRDKALKKLRKYIAAKSSVGFSKDDYLKICKGLHYSMWMQDKPLIQEELSVNITRLVHIVNNYKQALLFIKVFLQTEAREWSGIDFWRMDKFMMFVRDMINQSFLYLRNMNWDVDVLKQFVAILNDTLLDCSNDDIPDGIRIHLADIYLSELSKVGADQLTGSQIVDFLAPFVTYVQRSKNLTIVHRVVAGIFYPLISQTIERIKNVKEREEKMSKGDEKSEHPEENEEENDEEDSSDDDDDDELAGKFTLHLKYDCRLIADKLFEAGSKVDCSSNNRKIIYRLVKRLQNAADGVIPRLPQDVGDTKVELKEINRAVQALQKMEMNFVKENKKTKKKKVQEDKTDRKKTEDLECNGQEDSVLLPNGKRKKKSGIETAHKKIKNTDDKNHSTKTKDNVGKKSDIVPSKQTENVSKKQKKKSEKISKERGDKHVKSAEDAENVSSENVSKKQKKKSENISKERGDKHVKSAEDAENVSSEKQDKKGNKSIGLESADSTVDANQSSNVMSAKVKKKTGKKFKTDGSSSQPKLNTDKDATIGLAEDVIALFANKKKKRKKKIILMDENNFMCSQTVFKTDTQKTSSQGGVESSTNLSSTSKKKKKAQGVSLDKINSLNSEGMKIGVLANTSVAEGENVNVLSSKKKNKQQKKVVLQDKNMSSDSKKMKSDLQRDPSATADGNVTSSKKKNKKKNKINKQDSIPDSTVDTVKAHTTSSSSSFSSSSKNTKIKKKTKADASDETTKQPSIVKNLMDDFTKPLQDGEIEIFVPSKKWAGKLQSSWLESANETKTSVSGSVVAAFEKISQTPPAFVRKACAPHTLPRKRKVETADEAPSKCLSAGKKRVSFDPSRNVSLNFKDSLLIISDPAFRPDKSPSQGILKSPAPGSSVKRTKKQFKSVFKNTISNSKVNYALLPSELTPVRYQNRVLTRARAADFF
ncbi:ribosomal RNA processing protein 1 homolog B-like [Gigantopelta aegis]|uniref:ribosomal RNA processing protein 1 homolog B-like n=1 Tax=Gigantopelta aegis TaxID=1735272 RepID=UPI001B8877F2|nr:ribosomal RNA processing protein 1 homolog B-like [Gigantopelta aegis]